MGLIQWNIGLLRQLSRLCSYLDGASTFEIRRSRNTYRCEGRGDICLVLCISPFVGAGIQLWQNLIGAPATPTAKSGASDKNRSKCCECVCLSMSSQLDV